MFLNPAIIDASWYPRDRRFTEFEARIDFLLFNQRNWYEFHDRWQWSEQEAVDFIKLLMEENFLHSYNDDLPSHRRAIAQEIINIFNEVFSRNIQLDDARVRLITARIREGRKLSPPVGKEQFRAVFEYKKKEWKGTEHEKYLTIRTLCAPSHFLDYLEAARLDFIKRRKNIKDQEHVQLEGKFFK